MAFTTEQREEFLADFEVGQSLLYDARDFDTTVVAGFGGLEEDTVVVNYAETKQILVRAASVEKVDGRWKVTTPDGETAYFRQNKRSRA